MIYLEKILKKGKLQNQKEALNELSKYINQKEIISVCEDENKFSNLLTEAGIDPETQRYFINKMNFFKNKDTIKEEYIKTKEILLKKKLDFIIVKIEQAFSFLYSEFDNELYDAISRYYNDILSMCKFLSIINDTPEEVEILEAIDLKVIELSDALSLSNTTVSKKEPKYLYLINKDGIPYIQTDIDIMDPTNYENAYILLNKLLNNEKTQIAHIDNIKNVEIYEVRYNSVFLTYAKIGKTKIIVSIGNYSLKEKYAQKIYNYDHRIYKEQTLTEIIDLYESVKTNKDISSTSRLYNEIILSSLNTNSQQALSLKNSPNK